MKTYILGQSREQLLNMIPEKVIKLVKVGNEKVCIARIEGVYFVFEPNCPHRLQSLSQGTIIRQEVVCPLHHFRFDLHSGQALSGQCPDLKVFKARLTDQGLEIQI